MQPLLWRWLQSVQRRLHHLVKKPGKPGKEKEETAVIQGITATDAGGDKKSIAKTGEIKMTFLESMFVLLAYIAPVFAVMIAMVLLSDYCQRRWPL